MGILQNKTAIASLFIVVMAFTEYQKAIYSHIQKKQSIQKVA